MTTVFDSHAHCFPPLAEDRGHTAERLGEHQYHVRFHKQGIRRADDDSPVAEPLLSGKADGVSFLPDVDFRIGRFGRLEFTHDGEEYYIQWMPPTMWEMESPPEYIVAQMDYAGVDRAIIQHDRIYGHLDDYLAECARKYPDRFVPLAQVDEWKGGEPEQLDRLARQVELGHRGLYFSTGGFFHRDFDIGLNDPSLEPLWQLVADLGIPVHWYLATLRTNALEAYNAEMSELVKWAKGHPGIPCVLTHGLSNISLDEGPDRFAIAPENFELLKLPGWHIELMLHLMNGDAEFPPHSPPLSGVVRTLVEEVGADRLVWGSDMPCCERTVTYKQSLLLFQTRCDFLSEDERAAILGGNLERLYPAA